MHDLNDYMLANFAADLKPWRPLLPDQPRILGANLFVDIFLADAEGAVHMLELASCRIERISHSEDQFWLDLARDEQGRLLRPLVDRCREAGKTPGPHQCLAFTTWPILGGNYEVENLWVCPIAECVDLMGHVYKTLKDVPDGTQVTINID